MTLITRGVVRRRVFDVTSQGGRGLINIICHVYILFRQTPRKIFNVLLPKMLTLGILKR